MRASMHHASDERVPDVAAEGTRGAPIWVFLLVLASAVVLRFWNLGSAGISHWDAGTYTAGPLGVGPYGERDLVLFQTPPLVPSLFAFVFDVWEPLDTLAIGVIALIGVATVITVFLAGRSWVGDPAALAGAAALAGMQFHLLFSRQALTDVPFALFLLLAAWAFTSAAARGSFVLAALAGAAAGLAILTKYHGFLALAIAGAWLLALRSPLARREHGDAVPRRTWLLWLVACAVAAVPAVFLALEIERTMGLAEFRASRREWLSAPGLYLIPQTAGLVLRSLWEWVSPFVLVPALLGFVVMLRRRAPGDLVICLFAAAFLATLPLYRFYPRLLVPVLVPLAFAAGVGLDAAARRLAPRWRVGRTAAISLFLLVPGWWGSRATLALEDRGYETAARFLSQGPKDPDPDILVVQHSILFYLRDSSHPFLCYDQPGAREVLESGRYRFLVGDLRLIHAPEYREYLETNREKLKLVAEIGNPLPPSTVVNSAGFEGLDALRSASTPPEERKTLDRIRVWRQLRKSPR
jgi:4-amino-4-deoxy-L-arabinose transferase-like glycosyltransferase